ncbi:MAG: Crp/Fnr family transcriptional regulator [Spirochaetales bacterium]|nr:Crp/Fnr family transcriptional regulator [Spirochaetales bacterium]
MPNIHEVLHPEGCHCNQETRRDVISRLPFLKTAFPSTVTKLIASLRSEDLAEGMEVSPLKFQNGMFGVVAQGAVKVYRYVGDDEFVVFDVLTAGDFFVYGFPENEGVKLYIYPDQVSALTTTCLLSMDKKKLEPILHEDANLMAAFFGSLTARLIQSNERFVRFMAYPAEHKIAFLLEFLHGKGPKKPDHPGLIPFNLTRKDLASMAGLTLETSSRILTAFERDGIVRSGRGWVEILNFPALHSRSPVPEV